VIIESYIEEIGKYVSMSVSLLEYTQFLEDFTSYNRNFPIKLSRISKDGDCPAFL
jgi:hypothetical protein